MNGGKNCMSEASWLVRPRRDGGFDFVSFATSTDRVEMWEGSHLPPQMPLLKRRSWLPQAEAERQCLRLQREAGFRRSEPLF